LDITTGCGAFTERKLSLKASRWSPAGEGRFAESRGSPSRCICSQRSLFLKQKKAHGPPRPPPPGHRGPHHLAVVAACHRRRPPGRTATSPVRHRHLAWPSPPHVPATRPHIPPPPTHATYAAAHTYTHRHARTYTHIHTHTHLDPLQTEPSSRCARHHRQVVEARSGRICRHRALPRCCSLPRGEGRAEGGGGGGVAASASVRRGRRGTTPR
jgi:hypothetical protein